MTAQVSDTIFISRKRHGLAVLPLEVLFASMPDRPLFRRRSTACYRGYVASWKIKNNRLWLVGMKDYRLRERRAEDDIRLKELREKYPYHIMYLDAAKKMELHQCVISRIEGLPSNSIGIRQSDKDWHGSCVSAWNGFIDSDSVSQISTEQVLSSDVTPVPASWYSGLLRISVGDVLRYAMGYFQTEFETDRIIEIAGGAARRSWIIDNKPGHEARNHVGKAEFTAPPR